MPLIDSFERTIDYLRVSVTDRCNFRCIYCMPEEGAPVAPAGDLLTNAELIRILKIAAELGMRKFRLTGGEPLIRKDIVSVVANIASLAGVDEISLTTNGYLLPELALPLAQAGLTRINISLDTLRPDRFKRIARRGRLDTVLQGIKAATDAGLCPVKINCVVMKGYNDDEVLDFAALSLDQSLDVRFIELMPINWSAGDDSIRDYSIPALAPGSSRNSVQLYANTELATFRQSFVHTADDKILGQLDASQMRRAFVSTSAIQECIEARYGALERAEVKVNGPARSYKIANAPGTLSFISQITNDMCVNCNRLRLTADGFLRPCLMADGEVDLRSPIRSGASDADIADLFRITVLHKPAEHRLEDGLAPIGRNMSQLGG
jgi:GTP 3',8-cyclase